MKDYPKISIVTPSFNQVQYIEETIVSVLDQKYPNLEYIIIDGGSTDGSIDIIQKYEKALTYWISERDSGQVDALKKGMRQVTGDVFAWLNSDDVYFPGTLDAVGDMFRTSSTYFVYGKCEMIASDGTVLFPLPFVENLTYERVISDNLVPQPSSFMRTAMCHNVGDLNETLHYSFDFEYLLRILRKGYCFTSLPRLLSKYRLHDTSKTVTSRSKFDVEVEGILEALIKDNPAKGIRQAVARCYRRFAMENYYWSNDLNSSIKYFVKMLQTDISVSDIAVLEVFAKCLLRRTHQHQAHLAL